MFYENVFKALSAHNVRYLVVGGLAIFLHGVPRSTFDLDIIVSFGRDDLKRFDDTMTSIGYRLKQPISMLELANETARQDLLDEKHLYVVTYIATDDPMSEIDVLISHPLNFENSYARCVTMNAGPNAEITVASLDDLIELKMVSKRSQDMMDISALQKIKDLTREE